MESKIDIILSNGDKAGDTLKELTKQANKLKKEIADLKPGTEAFVAKANDLKAVGDKVDGVKNQINGTTKASDSLKNSIAQNIPGFSKFGQFGQTLGSVKSGVGGLTSSLGLLKGAIAATGIGFLVIAFATLVQWFQKTDEGATLLSGIMKGFGIVMDTVFGKLVDMFKGIGDFFTGKKSIKQGLIDLVTFIGTNLLNRVKAFLVIWQGIKNLDVKKATDGLIQLTTGVTDATDKMAAFGKEVGNAVQKGIDFEKQLDAIQDKARDLSVSNANTEKEVSRLLLQSKNVGLTYQERIDLLDQASKLELKNHQEQLANAKALEEFRKNEIADNKALHIQNDELDQQLADAQIARINLEKESLNLQEKIENRRTALIEKQQAEQQKEEEARIKAREKSWEEYYANLKDLEDRNIDAMAEGREKDLAQLKVSLQHEIEAIDVNAPFYAERLAAAQNAARQKKKEINDKWNKKDEADLKERVNKEIEAIENGAAHENVVLLHHLADRNINRRQFDELAEQNKKKAYEKELAILEENGMKETALYEQIAAKIVDIELQKQDKLKQAREQTFNAAVNLGQALLQSQIANIDRENSAGEARLAEIEKRSGKESAAYKIAQNQLLKTQRENFEKKKRLEKAQIKINALAEIAGIIKSAVEIGGIYGIIVGALLSAATVVRSNSAIQEVNAQQFKYGGIPDGVLQGPSHEQGGIPLVAEGKEIILTKGVYENPNLRSLASAINVAGGGRKFAYGGPVNPFRDQSRGPVSRNPTESNSISNSNNESLLISYIQATNDRIDRMQVINVMTKQDGTGYADLTETVNKIKDDADV